MVDGNSSSRAYLEFRGYDETGNNTRCYIISIDCLGYIDPDGGDTIPIPETSATKEFVEAKLSGTTEELNGKVESLSSAISTNSEDIATLSSNLSNLSGLNEEVATNLSGSIATISGEVKNLTTTTGELNTKLQSISSTVGTNAEQISTISSTTEEINEKISGLTNYELPIATADTLGGIKIGSGLTISEDGTLNADIQSTGEGTTTITTNAEWGKISGTLSAQTDLQKELNTFSEELNTFSTNLSTISSNLSDTQTNLSTHTENTDIHITEEERTNWNAKSTFSGNYNDLTNLPDLTIYATKEELTPINENLDTLSTTVTELSASLSRKYKWRNYCRNNRIANYSCVGTLFRYRYFCNSTGRGCR